jgi:hypothetical protein
MRVISIDFDGVLNRGTPPWDKGMVAQLNRITDQSGAVIIVHSSWRYGRTLPVLQDILRKAGVTGKVVGRCPTPAYAELDGDGQIFVPEDGGWDEFKGDLETDHERAIGVQRWLDAHSDITKIAIVDDMPALGHFMGTPEFFKTDMHSGLTLSIADAIIAHMESP